VAENPAWYHTLELAPGILTPGVIDLRKTAARILPHNLKGRRALDVGTFDGFWAFELEKRGAEVVAIDVETIDAAQWPPNNRARLQRAVREWQVELGRGFRIASEFFGSSVRRITCDVLELTPEAIGGSVDVVLVGSLLVHLRDPVLGLERVFGALEPDGELYQLESISRRLTIMHPRRPVAHFQTMDTAFNWWFPNRSALRAWLRTAGFVDIRGLGLHHPPQRRPMNDWLYGIASRRPG
jgi:SAM-dependent methyltransferase